MGCGDDSTTATLHSEGGGHTFESCRVRQPAQGKALRVKRLLPVLRFSNLRHLVRVRSGTAGRPRRLVISDSCRGVPSSTPSDDVPEDQAELLAATCDVDARRRAPRRVIALFLSRSMGRSLAFTPYITTMSNSLPFALHRVLKLTRPVPSARPARWVNRTSRSAAGSAESGGASSKWIESDI